MLGRVNYPPPSCLMPAHTKQSLCANPHTLEGQNAVKKSLDAQEPTETMHSY